MKKYIQDKKIAFATLLVFVLVVGALLAATFGAKKAHAETAGGIGDFMNCVSAETARLVISGTDYATASQKAKEICSAPQVNDPPETVTPPNETPSQETTGKVFNSEAPDLAWQRIVPNDSTPGIGQSVFRAGNMWFVNRNTPFATSAVPYADYQGSTCTFSSRIGPGLINPSQTDIFLYPLGESTGPNIGKYAQFAGEDKVYTCSSYGAEDLSGKKVGGIAANGATLPSLYTKTFINAINQTGLIVVGGVQNVKTTLRSMAAELKLMNTINLNLEGYSYKELAQSLAQTTQIKIIVQGINKIVVDDEMLEDISFLKQTVDSLATGNQVKVTLIKEEKANIAPDLTIPENHNIAQWWINNTKVG